MHCSSISLAWRASHVWRWLSIFWQSKWRRKKVWGWTIIIIIIIYNLVSLKFLDLWWNKWKMNWQFVIIIFWHPNCHYVVSRFFLEYLESKSNYFQKKKEERRRRLVPFRPIGFCSVATTVEAHTTRRGVAQEKWQAEAKRTRAAEGFTQCLPFPWTVTPFCQVPPICAKIMMVDCDDGRRFNIPPPQNRPVFGVIPFGWGVGWPQKAWHYSHSAGCSQSCP